jgi:hypothetical protein
MNEDKRWILNEIKKNNFNRKKIDIIFDSWHFDDIELDELTEAVLASKNPYTLYKLATIRRNPREKEIISALIKTKNKEAMYLTEIYSDMDDDRLLSIAIIKAKDIEKAIDIAKNIYNSPMKMIIDTVLKYGTDEQINDLICYTGYDNNNSLDLNYITKKIINNNYSAEALVMIARNYVDAPFESINKYLLKQKNIPILIDYAKYVKEAPIDEITQIIIDSHDYYAMLEYAKEVNVDIDKISKAMLMCKDKELLIRFSEEVPNVNTAEFIKRYQDLYNQEEKTLEIDERFNKACTYDYSIMKTSAILAILQCYTNIGLINAFHMNEEFITKEELYNTLNNNQKLFEETLEFYENFFKYDISPEEEQILDDAFLKYKHGDDDDLTL